MFRLPRTFAIALLLLSLIVVLVGCTTQSSSSVRSVAPTPAQASGLAELNKAADKLYTAAKSAEWETARDHLDEVADRMTKLTYNGLTTPEGLNALTSLLAEARKVYNRAALVENDALTVAIRLKLAVDALGNKSKPLWTRNEASFRKDAQAIVTALAANDRQAAARNLDRLYRRYLLIRPAVLVSRDPAIAEQLDSWFVYMNGTLSRQPLDAAKATEGARQSERWIADLFAGKTNPTLGVPVPNGSLFWAFALVGLIVACLGYVGWRKYKFTA